MKKLLATAITIAMVLSLISGMALYGTDGSLLDFDYMRTDLSEGDSADFGGRLTIPSGSTPKCVKAFVWDNINTMKLLSEVEILNK